MKETGYKIKAVGDKTTEVGKGLSTHVTAPIVAMSAASLVAFNEVDKGMDIITQKIGASDKALKEMKDSMKNLAASIPTDFETAGAAIGEVNTRFGLTGQKLEDLSGKFIKFVQLNNTDVSTAIDNTQKVISAFGLKAEDAGTLLDTMNAVGQRTDISMDMWCPPKVGPIPERIYIFSDIFYTTFFSLYSTGLKYPNFSFILSLL